MDISAISRDSLMHAYLLEDDEGAEPSVVALVERITNTRLDDNPDAYRIRQESFGVDEARALREHLSLKPVGPLSVAIVSCFQMTVEAQNALLKVLEDPPTRSAVFLIVSSKARILPTLRSRMVEMQVEKAEVGEVAEIARTFLKASPAKRLEIVKSIAEAKDKARARELVHAVINALHTRLRSGERALGPILEDMEMQARFLDDPSASLKLVLEHAALTAPRA
jgi:DNA polymerase III delta prime subunit